MGYTIPASLAFSPFFYSCQKNTETEGIPSEKKYKNYKVIIIGAGAAGLYAGWFLKQRGFDVTILEASNRIGGRIKSLSGFTEGEIELGADRIYGGNTAWYDIIADSGKAFNPNQSEDHYFFRQDQNNLNEPPLKNWTVANQYNDFKAAMDFIQQVPNYSGPATNVESAFTTTGLWNMVGLMNGMIGNRLGTSNARLGMKGYSQEMTARTANNQVFTLQDDTLLSVLEDKFASVMGNIDYNKQVKSIDYQQDKVTVTTQSGLSYIADRVVVAVPLTILKNGSISFSPALPNTKIDALQKFEMMGGLKVHLKFSTPFWKDNVSANLGSVFGHNLVPEIYISKPQNHNTPIITAYLMGERAEQFASMGNGAVNVILSYLDEIFTSQIPTQSFIQGGFHIMDWAKEPFINGAYSYPVNEGGIVYRKELASSLNDKVFFAGEATNYNGHSGTVHGAIESGVRVSQELEESVL